MSVSTDIDWRGEFGILSEDPKVFFASEVELDTAVPPAPQRHIMRRAFDQLELDGILCAEHAPFIYFKQVSSIDPQEVVRLHRRFWNHGGAPVLVLIAPHTVHVYSGLVRPVAEPDGGGQIPGMVETISRVSAELRELLPAVESGEFFRRHETSFNPAHRVDRDLLDNLQATREKLTASEQGLGLEILDGLLCRLVFTCYLFDRGVIGRSYLESLGLEKAEHLRDVLNLQPRSRAKTALYHLFQKLAEDFNGDLFSDSLSSEAALVASRHIDLLNDFFWATDVVSGQQSFWPYDFGIIPIETISAIYDRFLRPTQRQQGAFYTPRFLAEVVLDTALVTRPFLLGLRCLDPACGSGVFLVGLFNRMAEEWKRANPDANNDRRAQELIKILRSSIFGIDVNATACRITAFSLYLAYMDQLSPRDIQALQKKGRALPKLVRSPSTSTDDTRDGNIWCGDFFEEDVSYPANVDLILGNPPWGSIAVEGTPAAAWCIDPLHRLPISDKQIASAFAWKAAYHAADDGVICFILPHGLLFNHSATALHFQKTLFARHAVERVLNLADYQRFLFEEAGHPAIVIVYRKAPPVNRHHNFEYWGPKADWLVMRAEIMPIAAEDRCSLSVGQVLDDLEGKDAPQIWKQRYWATSRDRRLIDRLLLYPRLRDQVRRAREKAAGKSWLMAEGFQPLGKGDDPVQARTIQLATMLFIEASSSNVNLFLLPHECVPLSSTGVVVRSRSNTGTDVFRAPHVLVAKGFTSVAFADFDVSFRHALRGISGPKEDRDLLIFLAAYLRSRLARYFLFHTSSNWGISRQEVHVEELLRLPFPLPAALPDPERSWEIVKEISRVVTQAVTEASGSLPQRESIVRAASAAVEPLINEYFDVLPSEKMLIDDTVSVVIPSARPTRMRKHIPTIDPSTEGERETYVRLLCRTLNTWATGGQFEVRGLSRASMRLGIAIVVLEKVSVSEQSMPIEDLEDVLATLDHLRQASSRQLSTVELIRGAKVFDRNRLYVVKRIAQRFWTETASLNDADEIAGTILMYAPEGVS